jgi:two-component system, OmpR family, phosphate regulon sensor histidine kinase PhoR
MPLEPVHLLILAAMAVAVVATGLLAVRERELQRLRAARAVPPPAAPAAPSGPLDPEDVLRMGDWLGIGLLRIDAARRVVRANQAAHRMLNRRNGTLEGLTTIEAFVDHRIEDLATQAALSGSAQQELTLGGEPPRALMVRARRIGSDNGVWMVLEDISELRRLQRIRTEFIDNLSHELRTPLTTVRLLTEGLALEADRPELPPHVRDSILKIDVETGHLAQMVNELLDLATIEQGEAQLALVQLDLRDVVEDSIGRLRLYAERQGVTLRQEVPMTAQDRTVRGDKERLGQLLINLLHNAIKFSDAGDEVIVRVRPGAEEMILEVEDHGIGIPETELDRIFERFYKVDRARHRGHGGTGLGLAIARHIAERHGGRITVESTEDVGSRFVIVLPRPDEAGEGT